jgi:hypothetical protein
MLPISPFMSIARNKLLHLVHAAVVSCVECQSFQKLLSPNALTDNE